MKLEFKPLLIAFLIAALPCGSGAQKKASPVGTTTEDQQKLNDAYSVLESLLSAGKAKAVGVSVEDGGRVVYATYWQSDAKIRPTGCEIEFNEFDSGVSSKYPSGYKHLIVLRWLDIRSLKINPFVSTYDSSESFKRADEGFVLRWSYLKQELAEGTTATTKDGTKYEIAFRSLFSSQEDADRALRALSYAAKSCGAHETAF